MTPFIYRLSIGYLIAANLLLNLRYWPLAEVFVVDMSGHAPRLLLSVIMGILSAQAGLLGLWVYGNGRGVLTRCPHGLFVLLLFSTAEIAGHGIAPRASSIAMGQQVILISLAGGVFLASQAGLAIHARLFGERLTLERRDSEIAARPSQYSLSSLFVWTAEVALVLVIGRLLIPTFQDLSAPGESPLQLVKYVSVLAIIYALVVIPWVSLLCADRPNIRRACLALAICGGAILLECIFFILESWPLSRNISWSIFMKGLLSAATVNVALVLVLIPNLLVLRVFGYRFRKVENSAT